MKKNDYKVVLPIVRQINRLYSDLYALSNDELRKKCRELKRRISISKDDNVLDENLIECFAIVKDTARRFCEGEVKVTANAFDKQIAQKYDFVRIEGKYAVYKNEWKAGGICIKWDMIHYDTQLLSGIFLHRGYATEMATGEGKTLAVTLPAFLNSLLHKGVHIQTVNDYLSKRDCELTRPIYMFHGITADCLEYYRGDLGGTQRAYSADICFGSNESFVFDYLRNNIVKDKKNLIKTVYNYCVIDELDSILIDRACTPHILQGDMIADAGMEDWLKLKKVVEEFVSLKNHDELILVDKVNKQLSLRLEACEWFAKKLNYQKLFRTTPEEYNSKDEKVRNETRRSYHLSMHLIAMLNAYCVLQRDVDYVVDRDKIVIINPNTGRLDNETRWENNLHQAVEIKEGVECKEEYKPSGTITLGNFLKLYSKKCGMSGTISNVENELYDTYGLSCIQIPTYRPPIRKDNPLRVYGSLREKYSALKDAVRKYHEKHRPILISCISTLESENVAKMLKSNGFEVRTLNAKNLEKEAYIISRAGDADAITVSTAIAGRGTDIKLSEEAKATGGLLVISTCMFDSSRIDDQLRGRAGRQGDPGESVFFASFEDSLFLNLPKKERKQITDASGGRKSNQEKAARNAFIKAQKIREKELRKSRQLLGSLDNSLASCRELFYKERLYVLNNPLKVYKHLKKQAQRFNVTVEYDDHLGQLYQQVKRIFENAHNNNIDGDAAVIFSEKKDLFSLSFDIELLLGSQDYFISRFVQQLSLEVLDLFWSHFINRHRQSFSISEKDLMKDYQEIKQQYNLMILQKVFRCCVPVNFIEERNLKKVEAVNANPDFIPKNENQCEININVQCPCGSGKKYYDCHGKRLLRDIQSMATKNRGTMARECDN